MTSQPMAVPIFGGQNTAHMRVADFTSHMPAGSKNTRASGATRTTPAGLINLLGSNLARLNTLASTLMPQGLLVEGAGTNRIYPSNAAGAINSTFNGSSSYGVAMGPDGATSFNLYTENSATQVHGIATHGSYQLSTGAPYTVSVYVKPAGRGHVQLGSAWSGNWQANFNLSTGTLAGTTNCTATITNVGGGVYRITATATAAASFGGLQLLATTPTFATSYAGNASAAFYWFGLQIEQAAVASSYIPTTTAETTRAADYPAITNLQTLGFNPRAGTLVVEAMLPHLSTTGTPLFTLSNATNTNVLQLAVGAGGVLAAKIMANGSAFNPSNVGAVVAGSVFKAAFAYGTGAGAGVSCLNGTLCAAPSSPTTLPTAASLTDGLLLGTQNLAVGVVQGARYIRKLSYVPYRLSNSQIQSLTL